tara:strand:+ start:4651 stop:4920 length:270 start_codon:yes stop_codon:yes gene_type:complete
VDNIKYYKTLNKWTFGDHSHSEEYYKITNNESVEEYCPEIGWERRKIVFKRKVGRKRARLIKNLNDMYSVEQMIELVEIEETEMLIEML